MSGYVQVTFIGGPLDLTRMALHAGMYEYRAVVTGHTQDQLARIQALYAREGAQARLDANIVTYRIFPVGPSGLTWIAVPK